MSLSSRVVSPLLVALLLTAGCSGMGRISYDAPEEAYQKGMAAYEAGHYQRAAKYFQGVFDYGRTVEGAEDAQFYLGKAYYENEKYILAASEFNRFRQYYPREERVDEAEYLRAMSYYHLSPSYQMDQTKTRQAISYFQLFLERHPNSEYAPEAQNKIQELREKMAHKQYDAGRQYEQRGYYGAAVEAYESAFDTYPDTPWADDALLGTVRSYVSYSEQSVRNKKAQRLRYAIDSYERLIQLFPDSPLLKEAETLYETAQARLDQLDTASSSSGEAAQVRIGDSN